LLECGDRADAGADTAKGIARLPFGGATELLDLLAALLLQGHGLAGA